MPTNYSAQNYATQPRVLVRIEPAPNETAVDERTRMVWPVSPDVLFRHDPTGADVALP